MAIELSRSHPLSCLLYGYLQSSRTSTKDTEDQHLYFTSSHCASSLDKMRIGTQYFNGEVIHFFSTIGKIHWLKYLLFHHLIFKRNFGASRPVGKR